MSSQTYETIVVGAGAAGLGCALAAAREGAKVLLLEATAQLGGTVRHALIHTIAGLFDENGEFLNEGLPVELAERLQRASPYTRKRRIGKTWVLNADPETYARVVTGWTQSTPNIEVRCRARVARVAVEDGRIQQIWAANGGEAYALSAHVFVDTTGTASVVREVDERLVADGAASAGYILQLCSVAPDTMQFPKNIGLLTHIRKAAAREELASECSSLWLDSGVYPDEAYVKFSVAAERLDAAHMRLVAEQLLAFLRTLPGFAEAVIRRYGELGARDAGRIKGEYRLTEQDIKGGRRFADAACRACWPIEHWHPETGITLEYLPPGTNYDIPLRSLKVSGLSNLWAAGKCLSAEPRAQASARMAGTCWAMGEAVGRHVTRRLT